MNHMPFAMIRLVSSGVRWYLAKRQSGRFRRASCGMPGPGEVGPACPFGSLCSVSCGFPFSGPDMTRIPAFPPFVRRFAESSDVLHCLTRISRERGFDPWDRRSVCP